MLIHPMAERLRDRRKLTVQAIDLDPMNHSLCEFTDIHAKPVALFEHDGRQLDTLAEAMLTEDVSFIIDNGAAGFLQGGSYLAETDFASLLPDRKRELLLHAVVAGGGDGTTVHHRPSLPRCAWWSGRTSTAARSRSMA
jgi:hypothetical protein